MSAHSTEPTSTGSATVPLYRLARSQNFTEYDVLVHEWMSSPVAAIGPSTPVGDAYSLLKRHGFRRLPVVDSQARLIGIVTLGDLREARPSTANTLSIYEMNHLLAKLTVESVMTHNPYTVMPDTPMQRAAQIMLTRRVSGLPVIDAEEAIVGIITESDIFRMLFDKWAYFTRQHIDPGLLAPLLAEQFN